MTEKKGKDENRQVENTSMLTLLAAVQVHCKICKRNAAGDDSFVQQLKTGTQFTHHQKSVILDAAGLEGGPQVDQELESGRHPTIVTIVVIVASLSIGCQYCMDAPSRYLASDGMPVSHHLQYCMLRLSSSSDMTVLR